MYFIFTIRCLTIERFFERFFFLYKEIQYLTVLFEIISFSFVDTRHHFFYRLLVQRQFV